MTRIRQFANDMGISYNKAKGLIDKGKKRRDGGSTILENYMPIKIVAKKKEVEKPKMRPKKLTSGSEFNVKKKEKLTSGSEFNVKKSDGGSMRKPRKGEKSMRKETDTSKIMKKFMTQIDMIPINLRKSLGVKGKAMGGLERYEEGGVKKKKNIFAELTKKKREIEAEKKKKKERNTDLISKEKREIKQTKPFMPNIDPPTEGEDNDLRIIRRMKKKDGGAFPDLSGDGKVTQKDILIGRGVIKKKMGGIARGGGAAIQGTGFKGVY